MSAFNWRGQPSQLATEDKRMRSPVSAKAPGPASQITFSTKTPHSINTEIVKDGDKLQRLRKAAI